MIIQRTPEWYAAKRGKPSGSNAHRIMAVRKNGDPSELRASYMAELLAERLTGSITERYRTPDMERGMDLEEEAIREYERRTGNITEPGYWIDKGKWGCTPDAFISPDGLLSIKCPRPNNIVKHRFFETKPPDEYAWQAVAEMAATGAEWVDVAEYSPAFIREEDRLFIRRITRDNDAVEKFVSEVERFVYELDALCESIGFNLLEENEESYDYAPALQDIERYLLA
jgi:exodeoxyribonuclease (lambda-induced)